MDDSEFEVLVARVGTRVVDELASADVKGSVHHAMMGRINELVTLEITQAWHGAVVRTNAWGEKLSDVPTTIRDEVVKEAHKILERQVPSHGSLSDRNVPLLNRIVREEVERAFEAELKAAITAAKKQALSAVQEKAGEILAQTIAQMQGVNLR